MVVRSEMRRNSRDDGNRKNILAKYVIILILSFIVFVFAAVAWFAMNKNTSANGMGVTAKDDLFYLRVAEQSTTTYRDIYNQLFAKADSTFTLGETETAAGTTYYKTTGGHNSVIWTLEEAETGADDSIYTVGLNPGSSGTLKFEIVPQVDGDLAIDFDFNIRGFICEYYTPEEISQDSSINANLPKSMIEITASSSSQYATEKKALDYINGHVIFFTGESSGKYTGYIQDNVYHWSTTTAVKNSAIPVTIHWVWINTIDQVIYMSYDGGNTPLIADDSPDRTALLDYIKANSNGMFEGLSEDISNLTYSTFVNNATIRNGMENSYNAADQIIGTSLHYILFDMSAQATSAVPTPTPTPAG